MSLRSRSEFPGDAKRTISADDGMLEMQPHPIVYAELCYRTHPDRETLERYKDIVFNTADFMVSYAVYDQKRARYVLGPPLIPAQILGATRPSEYRDIVRGMRSL